MKLPADKDSRAPNHQIQPGRWRLATLAGAVALLGLGSLTSFEAQALALGRVTVQSALGEPLRAEIDIPDINAEEAASLRAGVAAAEIFRAAGLEYSPAVSGLQVTLQRRADGRAFLRLSSSRPVTEPFVDLILEASWASGKITRDYTMLFDPPNLRQAPSTATTAPSLSRPAPPATSTVVPRASTPPSQAAAPSPPAPAATPPKTATTPPARPDVAAKPLKQGQRITVKAGDTAGKIAAQNKPASISLDQMLVALLRGNPEAFIGGNVNRLKSGAVLEVPTSDQASAVSAGEATQTIVAQSKDFNEFRRTLAENSPTAQVAVANRQATGQVQTTVQDKAPALGAPDKLTLSKGAIQGKTTAEDTIAKDRQAKEAEARVAELSKNISELNKLGVGPASPPMTAKEPGAGVLAVPAPAALPTPAAVVATGALNPAPGAVVPPALTPASAAAAVAPLAAVSAPITAEPVAAAVTAAPAAAAAQTPAPTPAPEANIVDKLLNNPLVLPAAAGLLLLLAVLALLRLRKRKKSGQVDSSFLESRLQPDSFFGASGGQRIDTNEGAVTGSSMVYSPSQLDAAGDVDPVAEADVYLAYGRDLQAEEILKEALRTGPTRLAIHLKLMEIYAKRRDTRAFELVATEAFKLTGGAGVEWAQMSEMGRELEPGNALYLPGNQPLAAPQRAASKPVMASAAAFSSSTLLQSAQPELAVAGGAIDFELDLDFSLDDEVASPLPVASAPAPLRPTEFAQAKPSKAPNVVSEPAFEGLLELDFGNPTATLETAKPVMEAVPPSRTSAPAPLSALDNSLDFTTDPLPVATAAPLAPPSTGSGMLEFDMNALSLDLNGPSTASPEPTASQNLADPMETKFSLAEEFRAIGDVDGARSLCEEVVAQSSGALKSKAQAFLNSLS